MNNHTYDKPRSFYENEKKVFAKQLSYYGNRDKEWGERYGYDLAEPYSELIIQTYEEKYNIQIPEELRKYLVEISRETMGSYPYIITLDDPEREYLFGNTKTW